MVGKGTDVRVKVSKGQWVKVLKVIFRRWVKVGLVRVMWVRVRWVKVRWVMVRLVMAWWVM